MDKVHYIAMGGEHGCMPDNCGAYLTLKYAIEGLNEIYELSKRQLKELKDYGSTELRRSQGGAYCEVSECHCDFPWEHEEFGDKSDWADYISKEDE